jgi:hypothetical protein
MSTAEPLAILLVFPQLQAGVGDSPDDFLENPPDLPERRR